jgi:hypothetical protein
VDCAFCGAWLFLSRKTSLLYSSLMGFGHAIAPGNINSTKTISPVHGNINLTKIILKSRRTIFDNLEAARAAAQSMDLQSCPNITYATMLLNTSRMRVELFDAHSTFLNLTKLPAVNGQNHEVVQELYQSAGFRLDPDGFGGMRGWMRNYGSLACTLGHLSSLRWQLHHRVSFMLKFEDDLIINRHHLDLLRRLNCYLTRFLKGSHSAQYADGYMMQGHPIKYGSYNMVHYHLGDGGIGVGGEAYLTSLAGAEATLRAICKTGILNGFDFMVNLRPETLHTLKAVSLALFRKGKSSGNGEIRNTSFYNGYEWRNASRNWPLQRCIDWSIPPWEGEY